MPAMRVVAPGEKPEKPKKPRTVAEAAEAGTHLELLEAMRDRIALAVSKPDCPPRDLAALTRRLTELAKDIAAARAEQEQEARESGVVDDASFDAAAI